MSENRPRPIYLDHHATTPTDPRVAAVVLHHLTTFFGNASSVDHAYGDEAARAIEVARAEVARLVGASPKRVVFTSGATESINLALQGHARAWRLAGKDALRITLPPTEHRAVLDTCSALEREGLAQLVWLRVDHCGAIDLDHLEAVSSAGVDMVCIMAANNEIGTLAPLGEIGAIAVRHGAQFVCDATQAAGKVQLDVDGCAIAYLALSGHKFYGPKGAGALIIPRGAVIEPLLYGGGQERALRSGTLNVPAIAGLGEAARLRRLEMIEDEARIGRLRDRMQGLLMEAVPGLVVNGDPDRRLAGNLHVSVPGVPNTAVVLRLRDRVAISTGAACSSGAVSPSHVLRAIGLPESLIDGALRLSLGKFTTAEEIDDAAMWIADAVQKVSEALQMPAPDPTRSLQ